MMKLETNWVAFKSSFWFLPTFYGTLALVLSLLSVYLEESIPPERIVHYVPNYLLTDITIGQTILSVIATSILTMTTITFSSIMVVLTTYSSQFSPRTLQDFISDVITQRVLGVFTGGFIYTVLILLFLKDASDKSLFLAPGVAVTWAIVCLAFFVFFIHHVATWTQVNNLIDKITKSTQNTIQHSFHLIDDRTKSEHKSANGPVEALNVTKNKKTILTSSSGYFQSINLPLLLNKARQQGTVVIIERRIGEYVLKGTPLLSFINGQNLNEQQLKKYEDFISIGTERNTIQDVEFGLQKLVEIALRAISPGINDPHTAINCINRIGTILAELGTQQFQPPYYFDEHTDLRIVLTTQSYRELLYKSFYQIRHYARQDVSVCASTLSVLHNIAERNKSPEMHKTLWEFSLYFVEGIDQRVLLEWDKKFINEKIEQFVKEIGYENKLSKILLNNLTANKED